MSFLERTLEPPSYGYARDGQLYVPTRAELLREFASRMNVFADRKNWLPAFDWFAAAVLAIPFFVFFFSYFSFKLALVGALYSMVFLGTHGTVWLHRYCTHRAFQFRNPFCAWVFRNLSLRIIPEEIYVVSHYVHHRFTEKPGDPYNAYGGWLYCFLADAIHQPIARNLSEADYARLCRLMDHTGVTLNTYAQYRKWGSLAHPARTVAHYALNWAFWYGAFYWIGGHGLATAIFGASAFWAFGVRTFNYDGHGRGKDRRRDGIDFNRDDISINQVWAGYVSGEWHNNHHLYPSSARAGFLPYQLDLAWMVIRLGSLLGAVTSYRDQKEEFLRDHYRPWLQARQGEPALAAGASAMPEREPEPEPAPAL